MQGASSSNTSINKSKLPKIFGKLLPGLPAEITVFDYGCGKYTDHIRKAVEKACRRYLPYDPFNQTIQVNEDSRQWAFLCKLAGTPIIVTCSNVLNVIDDDETIAHIIDDMRSLGNRCFVTVYEGDKSGIGRYTGKDAFQRNLKLKEYIPLIEKAGGKNVHARNGMIIFD